MSLLNRLPGSRIMVMAAGASALILALAACSPGVITTNLINGADSVHVGLVCTTVAGPNGNCNGHATATVNGATFKALTVHGGALDNSYNDCTSAPCPATAVFDVNGTGLYGTEKANYTLEGRDADPATGPFQEGVRIYLNPGPGATFKPFNKTLYCTSCVEVLMLPGSTP